MIFSEGKSMCLVLVLALLLICSGQHSTEKGLVGYWNFDESLKDFTGRGNDIERTGVSYGNGKMGKALKLRGQRLTIPDNGDFQIAPGLLIDCWVYFDRKPEGYPQIISRDKEYQLRVDAGKEGGRFSFFVYLDGQWEPRVSSGIVPEPGRWYHLTAKWTGDEISLEVDRMKSNISRQGTPGPRNGPTHVGYIHGLVDELKIYNPGMIKKRRIEELIKKAENQKRSSQTTFGGKEGWPGWTTDRDAGMKLKNGSMRVYFPDLDPTFFNPVLDVDVGGKKYVSIDMECEDAGIANLYFVTDRGHDVVAFTIREEKRTSLIDLKSNTRWDGKLRFLGIFFQDNKPREVTIKGLWLSDKPEGRPFLYVRSIAPERAILRAGMEEKIFSVVHNLGAKAVDIEARLIVPDSIKILDETVHRIPSIKYYGIGFLEWRVKADKPVREKIKVALKESGSQPIGKEIEVEFKLPLNLPKASYVPRPKPVKTKYILLMHYCPLWKVGTHFGWQKIETWPERRPALGFYDEGTPEVADWHIKYAIEHGIQAFIYCWYRSDFSPEIHQRLGHAVHDGLLKARYLDMFNFSIMWENSNGRGVKSIDDMIDNLFPFWMNNYFKNPSYLKIDNKPVLFVWKPGRVAPEVGGPGGVKKMFELMRKECRKQGLAGLYIIGCVDIANRELLEKMAEEGWDASSAYCITGNTYVESVKDVEGIPTVPYEAYIEGMKQTWLEKKKFGALPDIVDVMVGWDPRPWHGENTSSYRIGSTPEKFKVACEYAKEIVDSTPGNGLDRRVIVFDNWNEFGEGHYIEPCTGYGFGFVDVIRDVFCEGSSPHIDIMPEDVGMEPPEKVYAVLRGGLEKRREIKQDLIAYWNFDKDDDRFAYDSSGCSFNAIRFNTGSARGIKGKGLMCDGGSVFIEPHDLFFPDTGITVELWYKTSVAHQNDRWMLNTIDAADTGYRLGMTGGRVSWQIPLTSWSHKLSCRKPADLGKWTHVAATYDNENMQIFINGEYKVKLERKGKIKPSTRGVYLGNYLNGHTTAFFEGIIDEVRIYNYPLTAEEIRTHYQRDKAGK